MTFSFGEIYFVNFNPSVGHEYQGERPAIVVQEENISKISQVVTIMPITSQLKQLRPWDILIQKDDLNYLGFDSVIKVQHIYSYDKSRFLFKIGRAGSPTIRSVRGYLRRHFGL